MATEGTTPSPADLSDDELERLQQQEDGEAEGTDPPVDGDGVKDETDEAGAAQAAAAAPPPAPTPEPTPAPTPAPAAADAGAEKGKIDGVQSKDGSRVLPYSALQAERRAARAASARADRAEADAAAAKQQLEDLKAGKAPIEDVTEDDVKQMEEDFPAQGKKLRALWERAQAAPSAAPKPEDGNGEDDPVSRTQELIDQVPLLLKWQHEDPEKFARAVELDGVINKSPKWKGKDAIDRFEHVTRLVADEYDVPYDDKTSSPAAAPTPTGAPAAAPNAAAPKEPERRTPETLSDFKSGATPDHGSLDLRGSNPVALLNKFQDMTDEEIDAQLAKLG